MTIPTHGLRQVNARLHVTDPGPRSLVVPEGIALIRNNLLALVEQAAAELAIALPLLNIDGVLGNTSHGLIILIILREKIPAGGGLERGEEGGDGATKAKAAAGHHFLR
jgi:hypothetical protein